MWVCVHFLSRSHQLLFLSEVASVISPFDWLCAKDGSKCRLKNKPRSRKSKASKHKKRHVVRKKFVLYFLYDAVSYIFFQIIVCASECAVPSIWQTEPRALLRTLKETACSLYFVSIFTTHEWNVLGIAIVSCSSYYCYYYFFFVVIVSAAVVGIAGIRFYNNNFLCDQSCRSHWLFFCSIRFDWIRFDLCACLSWMHFAIIIDIALEYQN